MNKIDFLINWQKKLATGLGEVILTEKTFKGEVIYAYYVNKSI
jgi:hypothetical protein